MKKPRLLPRLNHNLVLGDGFLYRYRFAVLPNMSNVLSHLVSIGVAHGDKEVGSRGGELFSRWKGSLSDLP
jgi:hypothetical protein